MSPEHASTDRVIMVIEGRKEKLKRKRLDDHESYPKNGKYGNLPDIPLPEPVGQLFNSPSLWLKIGEDKYTPRSLVQSFLVKKDKYIKSDFSNFVAGCKSRVAKKWGIELLAVDNKQKNQYWDQNFVKALFTYVYLCDISPHETVSRCSYTIRKDIDFEEMHRTFTKANDNIVRIEATKKRLK